MKCLELFCGIGGFAAAATGTGLEIVGAIDINRQCTSVYRHNFAHPTWEYALESIPWQRLEAFQAQLWWLSPPCQPHTSRGRVRDLADNRSNALIHLTEGIGRVLPEFVLLENVARFRDSQSADLLRQQLTQSGYYFRQWLICPSFLGIANRRLRYYLMASRRGPFAADPLARYEWNAIQDKPNIRPADQLTRRIGSVLIEENWCCESLQISQAIQQRYADAINWVQVEDEGAISTCFTSAYGRSPVYSGSYLIRRGQARYFSPLEIVRLLGFDTNFKFPADYGQRQQWNLAGNSLSVDVVRTILNFLPTPSL